ncbi:MAG TPA: VWA domain-containing protein [Baekduia sp.]|nr:VWA domain-containing protein [Baekduia sp.]
MSPRTSGTSSEPDAAVRLAAQLAAALRRASVPIGVDRVQAFVRAAAMSGDLYWSGRLTLLGSFEHIPVYDRVFHGLLGAPSPDEPDRSAGDGGQDGYGETAVGDPGSSTLRASQVEMLGRTRFDALSEPELEELARAIEAIRRRPITRRVRRRQADPAGPRVDLRRTAREMQRLDGDLVRPRFNRPAVRAQPLTFALDVSGSMTVATRALLLATASFVRADAAHEAFTFGTRLTRVTPALRTPGIVRAVDAAAELAHDRGGGTRIGASLEQLIARHGGSRAIRGAVVVIYSDGLERDAPELLARQMERLALRARRVLWCNPLSAAPDYRPLARGMQAALPFVDAFASGHDLASFVRAVEDTLRA